VTLVSPRIWDPEPHFRRKGPQCLGSMFIGGDCLIISEVLLILLSVSEGTSSTTTKASEAVNAVALFAATSFSVLTSSDFIKLVF